MNEYSLDILEVNYWETTDLLADLNVCFGANILIFWPYFIVRTITFLMNITIGNYSNSNTNIIAVFSNQHLYFLQDSIQVIILLLEMVCFGQIGTSLSNEVRISYKADITLFVINYHFTYTLINISSFWKLVSFSSFFFY